jgi:hypothetical protein
VRRGLLACLLALAGCAPNYPVIRAGQTPQAPAPAPGPALRSPIPRPDIAVRDQCGAADLQGLVGRPRSEIPVPVDPRRQRVACVSCPVTQEYNPGRLNFFFDADSGLIREVRCG